MSLFATGTHGGRHRGGYRGKSARVWQGRSNAAARAGPQWLPRKLFSSEAGGTKLTRHQHAHTWRLAPDDQETTLLLSLAYLGQLTLAQMARLLVCSERTLQRRLTQDTDSLVKRRLVERIDRAEFDEDSRMPNRGTSCWRLTEEGQRHIRTHSQYPLNVLGHDEQYPARPNNIRKGREKHDALVAETVVSIVESARVGGGQITGVFARFEMKLNPFHSAPWADAFIILHSAHEGTQTHPLPWTRDLPTEGEHFLTFAVELDRGTEPLSTIGGKAREYAAMFADTRWQTQWARRFSERPPLILWVVPNDQRSVQVQRVWEDIWPNGYWCITTFADLRLNRWQRFYAGEHKRVRLFVAPAKQLPPSTPPSPAPTQTAPPSQLAPTPQAAANATATAALPPPQEHTLHVRLTNTLANEPSPNGVKLQVLNKEGQVAHETLISSGSAWLRWAQRPQRPIRLHLPDLPLDVEVDPHSTQLTLRVPWRVPPPLSEFERSTSDLAPPDLRRWSWIEHGIDWIYHLLSRAATALMERNEARVQHTISHEGVGRMVLVLFTSFVTSSPVALLVLGQGLCIALRGIVAVVRALCWMVATVWRSAWGVERMPWLTGLARVLLVLLFAVLLPLKGWQVYDDEYRSWPCRRVNSTMPVIVRAAPGFASPPVSTASSPIRCLTRVVKADGQEWRRLRVDGKDAWAVTWMVEKQ